MEKIDTVRTAIKYLSESRPPMPAPEPDPTPEPPIDTDAMDGMQR